MKKLIVMRHAKSDWSDPRLADIDRPLNNRGERDAPRMGAALADAGFRPDLILLSPSERTNLTAAGLLLGMGGVCPAEFVDNFYPGGSADFMEALESYGKQADTILILAHNPGIESFVQRLTGHYHRMPTAAAALFDIQDSTLQSARLVKILLPREV